MAILVFLQLLTAVTAVDSCYYTSKRCVPTLYSFPICICKLYLLVFWCYLHFCNLVPPRSTVTKLVTELALHLQLIRDSSGSQINFREVANDTKIMQIQLGNANRKLV